MFAQDKGFIKEQIPYGKGKVRGLKLLKHAIYFTTLLILLGILLVQGTKCLLKYNARPTYMSTRIVNQEDALFPSVTICPTYGGYREDVLRAHGIHSKEHYYDGVDGKELQWTSNETGVDPLELYKAATYEFTDLVDRVYSRFFCAVLGGEASMTLLANESGILPWITVNAYREFGRCYSLFPDPSVRFISFFQMKIYV